MTTRKSDERYAQRQLLLISLTSIFFILFLASLALYSLVAATVFALLSGALMQFFDTAKPGGFEGYLMRSPVKSPLDWRVRELGQQANINVEPFIWARRLIFGFCVLWLLAQEVGKLPL
jgi:hypothetical protein